MPYRTATVCLNGHIVSKYQANAQKFCSKCGELTISCCPECKAPICGAYYSDGVVRADQPLTLDYFCGNCGSPYPWTRRILDNAVELVSLDDGLDESSKELIKTAIPDLIVETPSTPTAISKYKEGMSKAGAFLANSMRQLLIDAACEMAKIYLFQ